MSEYHDINLPGLVKSQSGAEANEQFTEDQSEKAPDEPEVRLSEPVFIEGDDGFQFNKKCKVRVKFDYLKKTVRKRVQFKLFNVYHDEIEDMGYTVEGFEENGYAEAEMILYYKTKYYFSKQEDTIDYCFEAAHTKGESKITSDRITLPQKGKGTIQITLKIDPRLEEYKDTKFTLYSNDQQKTYTQSKTVSDDLIDDNNELELEFTDVPTELKYTFDVDSGDEESRHVLFEDVSYRELTND